MITNIATLPPLGANNYNITKVVDLSSHNLVDLRSDGNSEALDFVGRQASSSVGCNKQVGSDKSSWVSTAMIPMAFLTFAMFLMDVLQRTFPYTSSSNSSPTLTIDPNDERWKSQLQMTQMPQNPNQRPKQKQLPRPRRPNANNANNNNMMMMMKPTPEPGGQTSIKIGTVFGKRADPFEHDSKMKVFPGKRKRKMRIFPKYMSVGEYSQQSNPYIPGYTSILDKIPPNKTLYSLLD